jgi:tetratricopeptide (TPR) repeat protein
VDDLAADSRFRRSQEGVFMRRNYSRYLNFILAFGFLAGSAQAQFKNGGQAIELKLPTLSQRAITTQRIGITDITINYCRPLVGGRKLWGAEVPYDRPWRSGANENTTISFTDDVSVEGKPLPAGTYGLHMIPTADQWTVIFSKNSTSWGSFSYDEKEDALRVTVKPHTAEFQEALLYTFDDVKPDSTTATLRWEKLAVPFRISLDLNAIVYRSIQNQLRNTGGFTWAGYDEAANYLLDANYKLDEALKLEDRSIQMEERFDNLLTKSQILDAQGKKQEAAALKTKAFEMASGFQLHIYGRGLQFQKKQDEAFAVFKTNVQKHPNEWYAHGELARMASAHGDFSTAVKEMNLALAGAPDQAKQGIKGLIARLEKKEDINP